MKYSSTQPCSPETDLIPKALCLSTKETFTGSGTGLGFSCKKDQKELGGRGQVNQEVKVLVSHTLV